MSTSNDFSLNSKIFLLVAKIHIFELISKCEYSEYNNIEPPNLIDSKLRDIIDVKYNTKITFDKILNKYVIDINPYPEDKYNKDEKINVLLENIFKCGYHYYFKNNNPCGGGRIDKYYLKLQDKNYFLKLAKNIDTYFNEICKKSNELISIAQYTCYRKCLYIDLF